jgi:hypothetical protein
VGENFEGVNWKGSQSRINSLKIYYGGVNDDLSDYLNDDEGDSLQFNMYDEGNAMIAFNSNNSFIELNPEEFNAYLQEDGLDSVVAFRENHNEKDSSGTEYYQRCAKVLLQIGEKKDNSFAIQTDLPLDIIPLSNPYLVKNNDNLKVKVFFNKQPLVGALLKIWRREDENTYKQQLRTDDKGEAMFPVYAKGKWMASVVHMIRIGNDPKAQWQSYWGSLTWGYE